MIRNFITALQFLTIFPVSRKHEITEANLAKSMAYFPLIGFILGVFL
ncbi:MAG TPA: adenosylcobinamide-GDP ribazoletransferase, partial [Nitrospiraceae bacterium]|nr:adenosylcobinamide-GDP ribazoletransferase [Nitrospiraceae bacterium]